MTTSKLAEQLRPIGRARFLAWGLGLFVLKIGVDYALAFAFDQDFTPLFYLSPRDAPLLRPQDHLTYWLTMWAFALPFIFAGLWFCVRRLLDARLPTWLVVLFFAPFANLLFFAGLALVPTDTGSAEPGSDTPHRSTRVSILVGGIAGAVVALGAVAISVGLLGVYGSALFIGAPTVAGFLASMVFAHLHGPSRKGSFNATMLALLLSLVTMAGFALEGIVCLIMASPLAFLGALLGWAIAQWLSEQFASPLPPATPSAFAIFALWLGLESLVPTGPPEERVVESVVEVDAPPEVVWERVIAFPDLPPPTELPFRAGVAAPTGAVIEGEGVGAIRRCQFTTGEFVEPITVWEPGRELSFDVADQPDPMREMTPFDGPRPPHLDGYFATTRGQFVLEERPDGGTALHGRTWYALDIYPSAYWAEWTELLVHSIHLRVMNHVADLAEADVRAL